MERPVCLVTGANAGLGRAIATGLARRNAHVILVCRDRARGEAALAEVMAETGSEGLELCVADVSRLASVRALAAEVRRRHARLHALVHAAAVFRGERVLTEDGIETMLATHHLGPFLLTDLLSGALKAGAPSRVLVIAGSQTAPVDFEDPNGVREFAPFRQFCATRSCNLLYTYELARRLAGTGVTVNALDPGAVKSKLLEVAPGVGRWLSGVFSRAPDKAADAAVRLCLDPGYADVTGTVFRGTSPIRTDAFTRELHNQARLWELSERLVAGHVPVPASLEPVTA
jgi:NAD(P)-dependent dehydrogenase (short-subunit alcohol dehydrogenase family)